jgi:hypothetical protein
LHGSNCNLYLCAGCHTSYLHHRLLRHLTITNTNVFMKFKPTHYFSALTVILIIASLLSGCLTPKKMDRFVSEQFNNTIPRQNSRKAPAISVAGIKQADASTISDTKRKTSKVLPLVVYWQWDFRHTCTLNPTIPVNNFANTLYSIANKGLNQKLNGQKLVLTVEQAPNAFALVDKEHIVWVVYAFSWSRVYIEPDVKDLVVSYQVMQDGTAVRSGKILVKNNEADKNLRFLQSWKSSTSEYLARYNQTIQSMTKSFADQLLLEL